MEVGFNMKLLTITILLAWFLTGCHTVEPPPYKDVPKDQSPSWSHDGRWVAYIHINIEADDSVYPSGLYIIDTSGNNRRLVIAGNVYNPDWSPDGKSIAFNSGDIYTITPTGDNLKQITDVGGSFFPSWSPDGNRITFNRSGSQEEVGIWMIDLPSNSSRRLGFGADAYWSPDGERLVYEGSPGSTKSEEQIWVMDTSGLNNSQLTSNNSVINRYPSWSPDGSTIAWTTDSGVEIIDADGSNQRQLYGDNAAQPSWSPDSREIVFSKCSPSRDKIVLWIISIDGAVIRQLTF
jgi:Tol biopolymer transport system component